MERYASRDIKQYPLRKMNSEPEFGLVKRREYLVYLLIFIIAGGSLFDIVTRGEHWPFSRYAMYSAIKRNFYTSRTEIFGVTKSDPPREISLMEPQYIQPLSRLRLSTALKRKPANVTYEQYYTEVLRHVLERYEALRIAGAHHGPRLRGIRFYKYHWKLDPKAHNVDRPDSRELILEITDSGTK